MGGLTHAVQTKDTVPSSRLPGAGGSRPLYCEKHLLLHPEVTRPAAKRGYNRRWQKARKSYLEAHPLCVQCAKQGKYVRATVVDHIIPHRGDQKLFWDQNNWQALCKNCHDKKTLTEDINPTYTY